MIPHPDIENLDVPERFSLAGYHLAMLTRGDLEEDYDCVTRSEGVLKGVFASDWPVGLTRNYDLTDLEWHHRDFASRRSFAWVIRDEISLYLGCAYLAPDIAIRTVYRVGDMPDRLAHLATFGPLYEAWLGHLLPDGYRLEISSNAHL